MGKTRAGTNGDHFPLIPSAQLCVPLRPLRLRGEKLNSTADSRMKILGRIEGHTSDDLRRA